MSEASSISTGNTTFYFTNSLREPSIYYTATYDIWSIEPSQIKLVKFESNIAVFIHENALKQVILSIEVPRFHQISWDVEMMSSDQWKCIITKYKIRLMFLTEACLLSSTHHIGGHFNLRFWGRRFEAGIQLIKRFAHLLQRTETYSPVSSAQK